MTSQSDDRRITPTREDIQAMTDPVEIGAILDRLQEAARKIEVDLEFCTEGSDDWEGRARSALAHHRVAISRLDARLRYVSGRKGVDQEEARAAKVERKAANAATNAALADAANERRRLQAEARERQIEAERHASEQKTKRQLLSLIEKSSFQAAFIQATTERYSEAEMQALYERAAEIQVLRLTRLGEDLAA